MQRSHGWRLQTDIGYPQLSCILDTRPNIPDDCYIISDGGIQLPGDFSKAYGAGADFVMSGGMFAGHEECSGDIIEENGTKYKVFYGMSSENAMKKHYGTVSKYRSSEGKCVKIKFEKAGFTLPFFMTLFFVYETIKFFCRSNYFIRSDINDRC